MHELGDKAVRPTAEKIRRRLMRQASSITANQDYVCFVSLHWSFRVYNCRSHPRSQPLISFSKFPNLLIFSLAQNAMTVTMIRLPRPRLSSPWMIAASAVRGWAPSEIAFMLPTVSGRKSTYLTSHSLWTRARPPSLGYAYISYANYVNNI